MPKTIKSFDPLNPKDKERFEASLRRIMREDDLINHRLSWLLTSQTIFLGTFALVAIQSSETQTLIQQINLEPKNILTLIEVVAFLSCLLVYVSLLGAFRAIRHFRQPFPPESDIVGPMMSHYMGLISPIGLPILFMGVWLFFMVGDLPLAIAIFILGCLLFMAIIFR